MAWARDAVKKQWPREKEYAAARSKKSGGGDYLVWDARGAAWKDHAGAHTVLGRCVHLAGSGECESGRGYATRSRERVLPPHSRPCAPAV